MRTVRATIRQWECGQDRIIWKEKNKGYYLLLPISTVMSQSVKVYKTFIWSDNLIEIKISFCERHLSTAEEMVTKRKRNKHRQLDTTQNKQHWKHQSQTSKGPKLIKVLINSLGWDFQDLKSIVMFTHWVSIASPVICSGELVKICDIMMRVCNVASED